MSTKVVPKIAQAQVRGLYAAYLQSKQDLTCFVEGLLLGMGLNPSEWELDTATMVLHRQEGPTEVYANGLENQR